MSWVRRCIAHCFILVSVVKYHRQAYPNNSNHFAVTSRTATFIERGPYGVHQSTLMSTFCVFACLTIFLYQGKVTRLGLMVLRVGGAFEVFLVLKWLRVSSCCILVLEWLGAPLAKSSEYKCKWGNALTVAFAGLIVLYSRSLLSLSLSLSLLSLPLPLFTSFSSVGIRSKWHYLWSLQSI